MSTDLKDAFSLAETLPEPAQKRISRELREHVERHRSLQAEIAKSVASLDAGAGRSVDIEDVIRQARALYGNECAADGYQLR
jgi:predicted transcriptional regulator